MGWSSTGQCNVWQLKIILCAIYLPSKNGTLRAKFTVIYHGKSAVKTQTFTRGISLASMTSPWSSLTHCLMRGGVGLQQARIPCLSLSTRQVTMINLNRVLIHVSCTAFTENILECSCLFDLLIYLLIYIFDPCFMAYWASEWVPPHKVTLYWRRANQSPL